MKKKNMIEHPENTSCPWVVDKIIYSSFFYFLLFPLCYFITRRRFFFFFLFNRNLSYTHITHINYSGLCFVLILRWGFFFPQFKKKIAYFIEYLHPIQFSYFCYLIDCRYYLYGISLFVYA